MKHHTGPDAREITLALRQEAGTFRLADSPGGSLHLFDGEVWENIIERAAQLPRARNVRLIIPLPRINPASANEVAASIRQYFARRREAAEHRRRRSLRDGWGALTIAVVLLAVVVSVAQGIASMMPATRVSAAIVEGLTIAGWVALWRPLELLLYDPWTARRDISLFRRLERAEVRVIPQEM